MTSLHEPVYTPAQVERLLINYLTIRSTLLGSSRPPLDRAIFLEPPPTETERERPFGYDGRPWPFAEPRHARSVIDGKARARSATELHVSLIDLETGLRLLVDDDLELIYKYFLFGTHTLEDLCVLRGVTSRASMLKRVRRIVRRLTRLMNHESE